MERGRDGSGEESLKAGHPPGATTQVTTDQREWQQGNFRVGGTEGAHASRRVSGSESSVEQQRQRPFTPLGFLSPMTGTQKHGTHGTQKQAGSTWELGYVIFSPL